MLIGACFFVSLPIGLYVDEVLSDYIENETVV